MAMGGGETIRGQSKGKAAKSSRNAKKKVTRKDIHKAGGAEGIAALIKKLVRHIKEGDAEVKESAASALKEISSMDHGAHAQALYKAKAIKPLVGLLSTGISNAQGNAARALAGITAHMPEHQEEVFNAGGLPPLVALLKTGSAKVQEEAASALAAMDANVSHQQEAIKCGVIPALTVLLKNGSVVAQASAAQATANAAAYSHAAQRTISQGGAIPLLLALLGVGKAQKPAASALAKLAHENKEIQMEIERAGGIAALLPLLNGLDVDVQVQAACALEEIARDNEETQNAIAKTGGIGPLLALLASRSGQAQSHGMAALAQLARHNRDNQDAISRMGGIKPLVQHLEAQSEDPDVLSSAACAIMEVAGLNPPNQKAVVDNGGVSQLANLMKNSRSEVVLAEVAGALWSLAADPGISTTIAEASTILPLVHLLGGGDARAHMHASHALASLGLNNRANQVQITQMLIDLLTHGQQEAQERATEALWDLVNLNPKAHEVIAKAGSPAALVELLKAGIPSAKDYALWSLSLSIDAESQAVVHECGGVQPLIDQLGDKRVMTQQQAAAALAKLAHDNDETRGAITKLGGVRPLIGLLSLSDEAVAKLEAKARLKAEAAAAAGAAAAAEAEALKKISAEQREADAAALIAARKQAEADAIAQAEAEEEERLLNGTPLRPKSADGSALDSDIPTADHPNAIVLTDHTGAPLLGKDGKPLLAWNLVHQNAADALANLAAEPAARDDIVGEGGIPPLVLLLEVDGRNTRQFAATALARLSQRA